MQLHTHPQLDNLKNHLAAIETGFKLFILPKKQGGHDAPN